MPSRITHHASFITHLSSRIISRKTPQKPRNITFITLNSHENAPQRPPPVSLQHPSSSKALRIPET